MAGASDSYPSGASQPTYSASDAGETSKGSSNSALNEQIHGSLVEVSGIGVLILGQSGVGKSECVIELVRRGQRLVADDVVRLRAERADRFAPGDSSPEHPPPTPGSAGEGQADAPANAASILIGWSPPHIRHFIEVRGLGLLSVADLFGRDAILDECEVGFVVRLEEMVKGAQFERIGLERDMEIYLGVAIPTVRLPVHAASNLATLVELAVRDWQLRLSGVNAARRLDERLQSEGGMLDAVRRDVEGDDR